MSAMCEVLPQQTTPERMARRRALLVNMQVRASAHDPHLLARMQLCRREGAASSQDTCRCAAGIVQRCI